MFSEMEEDFPGSFMVEGEVIFDMNLHVIHVDFQPLFSDIVGKDMVHEGLEHWWCIAEAEEHHGGFK